MKGGGNKMVNIKKPRQRVNCRGWMKVEVCLV